MSGKWHFHLLGGFRVWSEEHGELRISAGRASELMARLALAGEMGCSRAEIVDEFWPGVDPPLARQRLRQALTDVRRSLTEMSVDFDSLLDVSRHHLGLRPEVCDSDAAAFVAAARSGDLRFADRLYRGDLMPGCEIRTIAAERDRLRLTQITVLQSLATECEESGDLASAIDAATRLAELEPEDEGSSLQMIRLLLKSGSLEIARKRYRKLLRDFAISRGTGQRLPKDIRQRVRQWFAETTQTIAKTPSLTIAAAVAAPTRPSSGNIPHSRTRFFGREAELAVLDRLLSSSPQDRLITLVGPAGVGKTRLALELAGRPTERAAYFVPLADISDAQLIGDKILESLGGPTKSQVPALEQSIAVLSESKGPVLLVVDNVEHLLEHAAARPTIDSLLARVPHLTCLATSRQPLDIEDERVVLLSPLAVPAGSTDATPESLTHSAGAALFVDRMQSVRSDFRVTSRNAESIAELCRQLDGLPLALEIAATWARTLTPAEIVTQLGNNARRRTLLTSRRPSASARHGSLQTAIDWSYSRLPASLQTFFCRLHVFHGSFTEEAAAAVCEEPAALEMLALLEERSLVIAFEAGNGMRYRLLATLREYGREQLTDVESDRLERGHLRHYSDLAQQARTAMAGGPEAIILLENIEREHDNFRGALVLAERIYATEPMALLQLLKALRWIWEERGHRRELRDWLGVTVARIDADATAIDFRALSKDEASLRADLVKWRAATLHDGDPSERTAAWALFWRAHDMYTDIGDVREAALSLTYLGSMEIKLAYYRNAEVCLEKVLCLLSKTPGDFVAVEAQHYLAVVYSDLGHYAEARRRFDASIHAHGGRREAGRTLNMGILAWRLGDLSRADELMREALATRRRHGFTADEASCLTALGAVASGRAEHTAAFALHESALALIESTDNPRVAATIRCNLGISRLRSGDLAGAEIDLTYALDVRRAVGDRWGAAHALEHLGDRLALTREDWSDAIRFWTEAAAIRTEIEAPVPPVERPWREARQREARAALGDEAFDALWRDIAGIRTTS